MEGLRHLFVPDDRKQRLAELRPRLQRVALGWAGDSHLADDLVQEALVKALKNLNKLKNPDALDAWAFSILSNCFRDHCRRQPLSEQHQESADLSQLSMEEQLASEQNIKQVRAAVDRLSPVMREVLMLVDLEGFAYAEVAAILDIPVGTVMSRLSRARQRLKELLMRNVMSAEQPRPFLERVK